MPFPISLIKQKQTYLGLTSQYKPYIIGFKHPHIANHVLYHVNSASPMQIMRYKPVPIYEPITKTELTIDSEGTLFIPKLQTFGKPQTTNDLELEEVDYHDFITYPLTHQVGVIIPYVLVLEDEHEFIYTSHIIDPIPPN